MRRRRGSRIRSVAWSSLIVLLVATVAPAAADTMIAPGAERGQAANDTAMGDTAHRLSPAELEDITSLAEQEGLTLEDAIDKYAWQHPFAMLVNEIRQAHPDSFAGATIEPEQRTAWIAFKDRAPVDALQALVAFSRPIEVVEGRGFTEADLNQQIRDVHFAIMARTDVVLSASSGYDLATGEILVEVATRSSEEDASDLVETLRATAGAGAENVSIRIVDAIYSNDSATLYGGAAMSQCTSGYTLTNGSSRNLSTAHTVTDPSSTAVSPSPPTPNTKVHGGTWRGSGPQDRPSPTSSTTPTAIGAPFTAAVLRSRV